MPRCLHIYDSGTQCTGETLDATDFCLDHQTGVLAPDHPEESPFQKAVLRLVALILLIMFLIPIVYSLRILYQGSPPAAQEAW